MKIYSYLLFPTVLASLAFTTSVKAEEVSTKAADLMGGSNLLAQSSDPAFTPASPTVTPSTPLYTGPDVNPDLPASNYRYGSLSVGFGSQSDVDIKLTGIKSGSLNFNGAFSFNGAVGYQFEQIRAELEVGNQFLSGKDISSIDGSIYGSKIPITGNLSATTILINGYYDIPTGSKFRPYVGGGLGLGIIGGEIRDSFSTTDLSGTSFAYQLKAGVQYEITRKGNVFGELKYSSISSYKLKDLPNVDLGPYNSFGFAVGYRQGF
ncbi:outer membrane beta-barrel protein [Cylindrospermopsis raciborskii]|uniref:outer membrane beta-barrel protein n=1 Tax=Cylindrospermopsis raciborskii TaxID=77022 RepID=UPI0022C95201|nr:outer membrane beta-barrel protein [Cylindrospermopsis raciborskii]MCZ2205197.1 outer membrane beta-barrel protein [Cylindrospermopsis raciborskii PAMP2011]